MRLAPMPRRGEIRLIRPLYDAIRTDLLRPHPFAAERVGFAYGKLTCKEGREPLILLYRYQSVPDDRYVESEDYGALIDQQAILATMQEVRSHRGEGEGAFHVHLHEHRGQPGFSAPDRQSLPPLFPPLQRMGPDAAHGMLVLSDDRALAWVWYPDEKEPCMARRVVVAGAPLSVMELEEETR